MFKILILKIVGKIYGGVGSCSTMRVHASPSLNKRAVEGEAGTLRAGQSPAKPPLGQSSPVTAAVTNTVQDTDDRIAKDSIYGTIRMKRREATNEELARVEEVEDVDSLPPPPADDGYEDGRNPLLTAPKPTARKHNPDVLVSFNEFLGCIFQIL